MTALAGLPVVGQYLGLHVDTRAAGHGLAVPPGRPIVPLLARSRSARA